MAKSFHTIISEGTLEVDHKGETLTLTLPNWLTEAKNILMDSEMLTLWATEHEIIHGLLHAGIQKTIIDLRAKARPVTDKDGISASILDDQHAQLRVDGFVVKPTLPPGSGPLKEFAKGVQSVLTSSIETLLGFGIPEDQIVDNLGTNFDKAQIRFVLEQIRMKD